MTKRKPQATSKAPAPFGYAGSRATDRVLSALAERLLTAGEAAHMLRLSRRTVYNLIRCGDLPSVRVKRTVRLRGRDVLRFMHRHVGRLRRKPE